MINASGGSSRRWCAAGGPRATEQLHDEKYAAVLGQIIVEDRHRIRWGGQTLLGDVAFLEKIARSPIAGQVRVQHLDRDVLRCGGCVVAYTPPTPDVDQPIEVVLPR